MSRIFVQPLLSALVLSSLVWGVVAAADELQARTYDIKDVTEIETYGGAKLEIIQGDNESLYAEAKPDVINRLNVDLSGHKLTLGIKNQSGHGFHFFSWFNDNNGEHVSYRIVVKNLTSLELSGASHAHMNSWQGKALAVRCTGASEINFGNVRFDDLFVDLSGASNGHAQQLVTTKAKFELSGAANMDVKDASTAKYLWVEASGASNFRAKPLATSVGDVSASGASNIELIATETLKASASGASNIHYRGNAKVESDVSGASHVNFVKD